MSKKFITTLLLYLLFNISHSADRAEPNEGKLYELDFQFNTGYIIVPVKINGEVSHWVLDNGAQVSFIDEKYADSLELEIIDSVKVHWTVNVKDEQVVILPRLQIGPFSKDSLNLLSIDLSSISKNTGLEISGVVGYDFLSDYTVEINFNRQRVIFYDSEIFQYNGNGLTVDSKIIEKIHSLQVIINSQDTGRFAIDYGSASFDFHFPFAFENNYHEKKGLSVERHEFDIDFTEMLIPLEKIEIAGHAINKTAVRLPIVEKGAFSSDSFSGNLGTYLLRRFNIILDYKNEIVIVEKSNLFDNYQPYCFSGISIDSTDTGLVVIDKIEPGSPADLAGLKVGDIIIAINDTVINPPRNFDYIMYNLQSDCGIIRLDIIRDGIKIVVELQPVELHEFLSTP